MNNIKATIRKLFNGGFFHIFGSSSINKVVSFLCTFILVRVLSKNEYGIYAYALNQFSLFYLLHGFGVLSSTLQLCSEKESEVGMKDRIFSYGVKSTFVFDFILFIVMCSYSYIRHIPVEGAGILIALFSVLIPLSSFAEIIQIFFRVNFENKKFSFFTNINTICIVLFSIIGAIAYSSVGLVVGRIIGVLVSLSIGVILLKFPVKVVINKASLNRNVIKQIYAIAIISLLNTATGQLLYLIDVNVVADLIADSSIVAGYKVATILPDAFLFIPASVMLYFFPILTHNKDDYEWVTKTYKQITIAMIAFNSVLVVVSCLFSKTIIKLLFGPQYIDNWRIFCLLMVAYFFSASFRKINGNVLVSQRKLMINLYIGIFEVVLNLILNYVLVCKFNAIGAAVATLSVALSSSCVSFIYINVFLSKQRKRFAKEVNS